MINDFESLRKKLHESIEKYGINSNETRKISAKFDKMLNSFYNNEKQYHEEDLMHIKYTQSITLLRKITRDFTKFPSIGEWNKYAKEKGLLNSESLKYISGLNWHELRNRILSEI